WGENKVREVWPETLTDKKIEPKTFDVPLTRDVRRAGGAYPRILGQVNKTYIIAEWEDAVVLYDQHSAHERIQYEKYLDDSSNLPQTELLFPLPLELSPDEYAALDRIRTYLETLG